jgi:hypothetical protein
VVALTVVRVPFVAVHVQAVVDSLLLHLVPHTEHLRRERERERREREGERERERETEGKSQRESEKERARDREKMLSEHLRRELR